MDVAGEAEAGEAIHEAGRKSRFVAQGLEILIGKARRLQEIHHLFQTGRDEEAAGLGQFAHEELEHRRVVHARVGISLQHGELVEIRQQQFGEI